MTNRLFYTIKLNSSLLHEFKYNLDIPFSQGLRSNLIISLADSQILKSIRDITLHNVDLIQLEEWYEERDRIQRRKSTIENRKRIKELQNHIYNMMYIPQYISIVMESNKHYDRVYKKGFIYNTKKYVRFSCSASQGRVSTVIFVQEDIKVELKERLDNGRDLSKELVPSKYSAYFGLYSSAIKEVTKPRFCVIKDYCETKSIKVDFVIEKGKNEDDIIEERVLPIDFNRFDGSGLILPTFAEQWARDLDLDYLPSQFCIRYSFIKGMLNVFEFNLFCEEENNGNYIIEDIYGKKIDLRFIDVILTESQFKLWDSWESQEYYEECCFKNGLKFGVTRPSPKEDKKALINNYQFLQTLKLNDEDIIELCKDTVNYIQGVSYDDVYYTILFMLGENLNHTSVINYMKSSDNYWLKTLLCNNNLIYDKYSKEKIRESIIRRIEQACLGKIMVSGNFQCIVPDGYAFMEWCCGKEVKGLLNEGEFYSDYWNKENSTEIICGRSPMTHFSEWLKVKLVNNEQVNKWYKYSYSGIIVNVHDEHTLIFAGADYDFDILSTSNNKTMMKGVYENQKPVMYDIPKSIKKNFTEEDLYKSDIATFGSLIGQITNCATEMCALRPNFGEDSKERELLEDRIKMCCAGQSRQIDKAKIGREVKGIPSIWKQYQKSNENDIEEDIEKKAFYNSILCEKKPYFFRYKYDHVNKAYNCYFQARDKVCQHKFGIRLRILLDTDENQLTQDQKEFKEMFFKYNNLINSDCEMNKLCKHIESIDFNIKKKIKTSIDFNYELLMCNDVKSDNKTYLIVKGIIETRLKEWRNIKIHETNIQRNLSRKGIKFDGEEYSKKEIAMRSLENDLLEVCSDMSELTNYLITLFYKERTSYNKSILWGICGKQIYKNSLEKSGGIIYIPEKNENGSIDFIYNKYSIERVNLRDD